jgi:CBS domain-containing protein
LQHLKKGANILLKLNAFIYKILLLGGVYDFYKNRFMERNMKDIREMMTAEPTICTPLTSIENIEKLMAETNSKEILVVDTILEKHILGTINKKDIDIKAENLDIKPESLNAEICMRPILVKVRETTTIEECERILEANKLDHLVIVDEEGHLCGVYKPAGLLPVGQ